VRVDVQVGVNNSLVQDLRKEDFIVYDENAPRPIEYFGREAEQLDLLLLLDVSGSMRRFLEQIAATARQALVQLHANDRAGVMLFSRRSDVRQPFSADLKQIEEELKKATKPQDLGAGTRITQAVTAAGEYMGKNAGTGRRAVLILTDGMSMDYQFPDERAINALLAADTSLNAIVVGRAEPPDKPKPGTYVNPDFTSADVWEMAARTGGEVLRAEHAGKTFQQMIERIRTRYSLQYRVPENAQPGSFRQIRVELSPEARRRYPKAWIRARSGYFVAR
jgi:VWFA-related protein